MKHPVQRRLMYLGFQGLRAVSAWVPLGVIHAIGRLLGTMAYLFLGQPRRLAQQHLAYAFGETLTPAQRRRIARGVFRNLGQNAMEWLRLPRLSLRDLQQLVSAEGLEHLRAALTKGNGAIALTAHFGNWELIPLYLRSVGFEGGVLARRLRYPEYESFLIGLRGARGVPTYARGSVKEVAKVLRANQIIGMLPDQDMDSLEGIFVEFFGHPAYTPVGPAALSLMTGAPIVPCFIVRDGARFRLLVEPPLPLPAASDRTQAIAELTQAWSRVVEARIRQHPDHWVWMHRRWKTRPQEADGRGQKAEGRPQTAEGREQTAEREAAAASDGSQAPSSLQPPKPAWLLPVLLTAYCLLPTAFSGCGKPPKPAATESSPAAGPDTTQQMSSFTLTGYQSDGSKRWILNGRGAVVDGDIVTILRPDGTGFDVQRTTSLTASAAQVRQGDRHVRFEQDVTMHTSDGLWLFTQVLHWVPDRNEVATDLPVRLETDHMLLRGYGLSGLTQLKEATIFKDIALVLNPTEHTATETSATETSATAPQPVTITCDGPLLFDYARHIATFNQHVHVVDPNGELFSDTLVAYLNEQTRTIRYAEAMGHVKIHQQQNTASSERAVYEPAIGKMTLVGRPSLLIYPSDHQRPEMSFGGLVASTTPATAAPAEPHEAGKAIY